jgi:hexosaminidase
MPMPSSVKLSAGGFRIDKQFVIEVKGDADPRIYKEASRFFQRVAERTGIFFKSWIVDRNSRIHLSGLSIETKRKGKVQLGEDESYELLVNEKEISLKAANDIGAIRGLETLFQLVESDQSGFFFKSATIKDSPRFSWRGLLISQPYHFMPMDVIKRTLDAMALVKMNVLHFYISDDQGYRIESKVYPRLHQLASDGQYFTHEQVKEMIEYAHQRGIRVVPEIDVPGHSTAMIYAYPHLASIKRNYQLQDHWGVFDPTLDPTKESTYQFLDTLLTEVASLFPDEYFHIGGDENTGKDWKSNPEIVAFMKSNNLNSTLALQNYFNKRVQAILRKSGKKTIGWDEVLMNEMEGKEAKTYFEKGQYDKLIETDVPRDMVIQSWRGMEALLSSAKNGYKSILSKGYYIDLVQSAEYHYLNDPVPFNNDVIVPDSEANFDRFESDIINKIKKGEKLLSEAEEKLILGGEATMWTEHVTHETIDSRIWPRTAAIAERLWSPATIRNVDNMYRRMDKISVQLEWVGSTHIKNIDMMLRRMSGQTNTESLRHVVDLLQPVQGYKRNAADNFTRFSPYTLLVDIAVPDQKAVREFSGLVNRYLRDRNPQQLDSLINRFNFWISNHNAIEIISGKNPLLGGLVQHSKDLSEISRPVIDYLKSSDKTTQTKDEILKKVKVYTRPIDYCELKVMESIEKLIQNF